MNYSEQYRQIVVLISERIYPSNPVVVLMRLSLTAGYSLSKGVNLSNLTFATVLGLIAYSSSHCKSQCNIDWCQGHQEKYHQHIVIIARAVLFFQPARMHAKIATYRIHSTRRLHAVLYQGRQKGLVLGIGIPLTELRRHRPSMQPS